MYIFIFYQPLTYTDQLEAAIAPREYLFNRLYSSDFTPYLLIRDIADSDNSLVGRKKVETAHANFNAGNGYTTSSK